MDGVEAQPVEFCAIVIPIRPFFWGYNRVDGGSMKLLVLFSILLSGTLSLFAASGDLQVNPSQQVPAKSTLQVDDFSANQPRHLTWLGENQLRHTSWLPMPHYVVSESTVCYKMRSYHMVRLDRDSDVTRQEGYSTCEPASRFGVKKTIQKMAEPESAVSH